MKLKTHEICKECPSCTDLLQNGNFYCNMKVNDSNINNNCSDISCFIVDPNSKLNDCPWDKISETIETLSRDDQIGLKCMAKMFGGKDNDFFEDDPPCNICNTDFSVTIRKTLKDGEIEFLPKFCPECGRKLR